MKKEIPLVFTDYAMKDSQRLKEAFFSEPRTEPRTKDRTHNRVFITLTAIVILSVITAIITARYDIFVLKKVDAGAARTGMSLLDTRQAALVATPQTVLRQGKDFIYLTVFPNAGAGLSFYFARPQNLTHSLIFVYLNSSRPVKIDLAAKDTNYISNAGMPVEAPVTNIEDRSYSRALFDLSAGGFDRTNLAVVDRLTLNFHPVNNQGTNVVVRDIVIADKN